MFIIIWLVLHFFVGAPPWVLAITGIIAILEAIQWIIVIGALVYGLIEARRYKD